MRQPIPIEPSREDLVGMFAALVDAISKAGHVRIRFTRLETPWGMDAHKFRVEISGGRREMDALDEAVRPWYDGYSRPWEVPSANAS